MGRKVRGPVVFHDVSLLVSVPGACAWLVRSRTRTVAYLGQVREVIVLEGFFGTAASMLCP